MLDVVINSVEQTTDNYGNPSTTNTTRSIQVDEKDFQPKDFQGLDLKFSSDTGLAKRVYKTLFLKSANKGEILGLATEVEIENTTYKVADIMRYPKHDELVLVADVNG